MALPNSHAAQGFYWFVVQSLSHLRYKGFSFFCFFFIQVNVFPPVKKSLQDEILFDIKSLDTAFYSYLTTLKDTLELICKNSTKKISIKSVFKLRSGCHIAGACFVLSFGGRLNAVCLWNSLRTLDTNIMIKCKIWICQHILLPSSITTAATLWTWFHFSPLPPTIPPTFANKATFPADGKLSVYLELQGAWQSVLRKAVPG